MGISILLENQKKRLEHPVWLLICFSMFCFWQMGIIYFIGPALNIDGRTPLPINVDNTTMLIAAAYVVSIFILFLLPEIVVWAERVCAITALVSILMLFFPFDASVLVTMIYIHEFSCCVMIGFETFLIVNYFSENNAIKHLTVAYGVALLLISTVQNDFFSLSFSVFRVIVVITLILMLIFFFKMPAGKESLPRYVKKSDNFTAPKKLLWGSFILIFVSALMAVSGPAIADEVKNGVFCTYCFDAVASFLIYILYIKFNVHPFRSISICITLGCFGFLLMFVSNYLPAMTYPACALIGIGMLPCQMIPLYCVMIMKSYPSRFLTAITITLALVAVLVQGSMVEFFREAPMMLNLTYAVIMVGSVIIYLYIEPYFMYSFGRKIPEEDEEKISDDKGGVTMTKTVLEYSISEKKSENNIFPELTKRELEVLDLIGCGYSNSEIAKALFISEHTVNDYTKKIYRKLDVHSRHAAAQLINKARNNY